MKDIQYDMAFPQFSVNDVSEMTGISAYSIRYFDRIGLVAPKRDENGQRIYSYYDILDLTRRNRYKGMGFSLHETEQILSAFPADDILALLDRKQESMQRQMANLKMAEYNLSVLSSQLRRMKLFLNKVTFLERRAAWHIPHSRDGIIRQDVASCTGRALTGNYLYAFSFPEPAANGWDDCSDWDITVEPPFAEQLGFDKIPGSFLVPEEMCLYTVICVAGTEFFKRENIRLLYDYAADNSMEQNGTIYGRDIVKGIEDGRMIRYYEVWMPVKSLP